MPGLTRHPDCNALDPGSEAGVTRSLRQCKMKKRFRSNGSALLLVLVAVAIILVLMAVQMRTLFIPQGASPLPTGIEHYPWRLDEFLVAEGETIKLPRSPKPTLDEAVSLNAAVSRDGLPRGNVSITFGTDGRIQAAWESQYESSGKSHTITAEMTGNIVVKKTYTDDNGKDKSRLFLVAKGRYQKQAMSAETTSSPEKGDAWLSGWLKPDLTAEGHISIGQNTDWTAVYDLITAD